MLPIVFTTKAKSTLAILPRPVSFPTNCVVELLFLPLSLLEAVEELSGFPIPSLEADFAMHIVPLVLAVGEAIFS